MANKVEAAKPTTVETPKTSKVEIVTKKTPVNERLYKLNSMPSIVKGKQRQIVLNILNEHKKPMTIAEITPLAEKAGLVAVGGVGPSVRYHLHHAVLLGIVNVENPTITVEKKAAEAKAA